MGEAAPCVPASQHSRLLSRKAVAECPARGDFRMSLEQAALLKKARDHFPVGCGYALVTHWPTGASNVLPPYGPSPQTGDRVRIKGRITADNGNLLYNRLRDQQAVERITMMEWQGRNDSRMIDAHG
jgi:hypothetical protein